MPCHGCNWNAIFKYVDLHHLCHRLWVWLKCFIQVCWLASPMYALDLMKYADLHHPGIYFITPSKYVNLYYPLSLCYWIPDMTDWYNWIVSSMYEVWDHLDIYHFNRESIVLFSTFTAKFTAQWGREPFIYMFIVQRWLIHVGYSMSYTLNLC